MCGIAPGTAKTCALVSLSAGLQPSGRPLGSAHVSDCIVHHLLGLHARLNADASRLCREGRAKVLAKRLLCLGELPEHPSHCQVLRKALPTRFCFCIRQFMIGPCWGVLRLVEHVTCRQHKNRRSGHICEPATASHDSWQPLWPAKTC